MSRVGDACMVAIQRAFPDRTEQELDDLAHRFFQGRASQEEAEAIAREFAKLKRADIGRGPLADDGSVHSCVDCGGKFTGPGERCPVCVSAKLDTDWSRVGPGLLRACRVALAWIEETGEPTGVTDELRAQIEAAERR